MAKQTSSGRRFLTTTDVARYCEVSNDGVLKWIKTAKLHAFATPGGHYRISAEDFREFLTRYEFPIREAFFAPESETPRATRILVINEDGAARDAIERRLLKINPSWRIDQAPDCCIAGIKIGSSRPNLIVLDAKLFGLDAAALCRAIRANPETRTIRIVAIAAGGSETIRIEALDAGADACLLEPLDLERFRGEVLRLLAAPHRARRAHAPHPH